MRDWKAAIEATVPVRKLAGRKQHDTAEARIAADQLAANSHLVHDSDEESL